MDLKNKMGKSKDCDYHKKCDEEKLVEEKETHRECEEKHVDAIATRKCKKICFVEFKKRKMVIDTHGRKEVYDLKEECWIPPQPVCDKSSSSSRSGRHHKKH